MKRKWIIILVCSTVALGCGLLTTTLGCAEGKGLSPAENSPSPARAGEPVYVPEDFIACVIDVGQIKYLADKPGHDSWQTPAQTAKLGRGDCEDIAIYFQELLRRRGYKSEVVFGLRFRYSKVGHCWVEVLHEGKTYICEPRGNAFIPRESLPAWRYIRAEDIDILKEKIRRYHTRTGVYVNSKYGQAIEAEAK
ncbi:MAG: hypothetical protein DRP83_03280 [Planctomycetota bacterium]|nr:MAG: hypothetical protein DRP83_03280 [Planctomycetota bacterium]